ncbi:MAG: glycine--tRNA ligase subunit beta [Firmicutes bacterium]|nr:glycine--tRNA ligase subunit beta [Bacillota bacterium]
MAVQDLLLEIGCEELPARFMPGSLQQLKEKAAKLFAEHDLTFGKVHTYGTPRRLVLLVKKLADKQPAKEEKIKGPPREIAFDDEGNPTKAALGFAAKFGFKVEELTLGKEGRKEYLIATREIAGKKTTSLLLKLLPLLIKSLVFPKNMFWEKSRIKFPRPIRWLLCLYGDKTVPFSYGELQADRKTWGHRFLAPVSGPIVVSDPSEYFSSLEKSGVIVDQEQRLQLIEEKVSAVAADRQLQADIDPALLEEVSFLVESPEAVLCSFPEDYLQLPREVLVTTMQSHQRYFPVESAKGELSSYFVAVSNNSAAPLEKVRSGNEKVLKARLADASFFYKEDLKTSLEEKVEKLNAILFQEDLGTVYEKTMRLVKLSNFLAERFNVSRKEKETAARAAYLCKADLPTDMVGEFPELQGIMGKIYALKSSEEKDTAEAILEHYRPRFAGDSLPQTKPGILVALADKADHLAGCFALGIRPTGSQDPYALRRNCLGLLQILSEQKLPLSFNDLIAQALVLYQERENLRSLPLDDVAAQLHEFAWQRLRYYFQEKEMDYDLIDAVLSAPEENVAKLRQRVKFLQDNRQSENLKMAAAAYNRVANLAHQARPGVELVENLLREEGEKKLFTQFAPVRSQLETALNEEDYRGALALLAKLKTPLDDFFDEVLVMVEEETIRFNRLALLKEIKKAYLKLADFSKIVFPALSP